MKRVVHFMPANGFPSAVYNPIMKGMETKLQQLWPQTNVTVRGSDVYDVLRSPDATCEDMAKDCIRNIEQYSDEPVIGIGHSLGTLESWSLFSLYYSFIMTCRRCCHSYCSCNAT